tara:strand:+ start:496 stop:2838 length:2343 start_codon:yes stop_codon:yes gene_type:complete
MDKAGRSTKRQTKQMSDDFKKVSTAVTAVAAASAAGATALLAFTDMAARNARELRNQAQVASATVEEFQRMAYGAREFGIEEEKLSDILKDVNDRIGDFIATGGGPMADFFENIAPKVGLTADAFRNLSGPQALQLFYDSLEKANLAQEDMTFYLEAMASDTTALMPLLRNGGERLGEMADEADRLGIVLSTVEVAQLSQVAIELDKARALVGGVGNALAVELAPFVLAIAEDFGTAVESVGDMQAVVEQLVDTGVLYLGTFLDAVWEVDTSIKTAGVSTRELALVVARSMANATTAIIEGPVNALNFLIEKMNNVPGIDIDFANQPDFAYAMRDQVEVLEGALRSARIELDELAAGAAPSERLNEFIQQARAAADAITVDTPASLGRGTGGPSKAEQEAADESAKAAAKATDAINQQVAALEQQAAMLGMADEAAKLFELTQEGANETQLAAARAALETISAYQSSEEAAENYQSLLQDLRTTEEELTYQMHERLAVLDAANVSADEYAAVAARIKEASKPDEDETYWEKWLESAEGAFSDFDKLSADVAESFSGGIGDALEGILFDLEDVGDAGRAVFEGLARSTVNALGQMAGQWLAYQAVQLAVGKTTQAAGATAISANAQAGVFQAGINAFSSTAAIPIVGPALAPAAMAAAIGATQPLASATSTAALAGMAHDGIDSIPETGTWLLEKGERVTTADTSAKLDATLARVESQMNRPGDSAAGGSGSGLTIHNIDARGSTDPAATGREVERAVERAYRRVGEDFASNGQLRRLLGV